MRLQAFGVAIGVLVTAFQVAPSVLAQTALTPAAGSYRYHVHQRGQADITVDAVISQTAAGLTFSSKASYGTSTMVGTSGAPGQAQFPVFQYHPVDIATTMVLSPALDPVSFSTSARGDPVLFTRMQASERMDFSDAGASVTGSGLRKPVVVPLASGTTHFVVGDGWNVDWLLALPAQLTAWKDGSITLISAGPGVPRGYNYATTMTSPQTRPKGVPATDVLFKLDGPGTVMEWADPTTLIPDLIQEPSFLVTRDGLRY